MESKCPCCRGAIGINEKEGTVDCFECQFGCAPSDLPRIAAAMELAKLTVQMKTCRAYCPERAFLFAQDRVLEVFGGEQ